MYEPANGYRPGGFHPVLIGDVLNGHFKVANKLGFSTKATVGLCRDLASGEWRAIKIYAAESSHDNLASAKAQATLHLTASLEHFWVFGPNGRHLCAIQRLVGPSIALAPYHYGERPLFLKDLCRQMATAVSSFHKQGLYHGRLHPDNIRFVVDDTIHELTELTEEKMNRVIGYPYTSEGSADLINKDANLSLSANVPKYLVSPAALDFSGRRLRDSDDDDYRGPYVTPFIALADLDACTQHPPNNNTTTTTPTTPAPPFKPTLHPSSYTPPETWATTLSPNPLLTTSTDTREFLWVREVWGGVEEVEDMEEWWLGLWERGLDPSCKRSMEREDVRLFADLLEKMLRWRPEERASIEEVLEHPWIRDGAGLESDPAYRPVPTLHVTPCS